MKTEKMTTKPKIDGVYHHCGKKRNMSKDCKERKFDNKKI